MTNLINLSGRNLFRYKRRTFLTLTLIVVGVLFVAGFIAVTGSFKSMMIGQITDSFVGHMQIHRKGYLAAIDNLPLTMNLKPGIVQKVAAILKETPEIESYSPRIKFGGMFSNFIETTNIRLNGVDPELEAVDNPYKTAKGGAGPSVVPFLAQKGVAFVVAGEFGEKMIQAIEAQGIGYLEFSGSAEAALKKVLEARK